MPSESAAVAPNPGRTCPVHYRYAPNEFSEASVIEADTVYVAGGLYGNLEALDALEQLAARDARAGQRVAVIFNGDFHWFDAEPEWFSLVNARVFEWCPMLGNVEAELGSPASRADCGCAYPDYVSDAVVTHSNAIIERLHEIAPPAERAQLTTLPKVLAAQVGGERIVAVHGDTESLAGWQFAAEHLAAEDAPLRRRLGVMEPPTSWASLSTAFRVTDARVIASAHTCLPCASRLTVDGEPRALFNNGAAGMPNFEGTHYGIATRISAGNEVPTASLYGFRLGPLRCDAVRLDYDQTAWLDRFLARWPQGSSAHTSYFRRLCDGPAYRLDEAVQNAGLHTHASLSEVQP
ncbi:MAG: hypothetical protein ACRETC_00635 [Gammaproteobacteria bacterium]